MFFNPFSYFALTEEVNECNKKISCENCIKTEKIKAVDFINNKLLRYKNKKTKACETADNKHLTNLPNVLVICLKTSKKVTY